MGEFNDSKKRLKEFLEHSREDLGKIVENIEEIVPEREDIHKELKEAFKETADNFNKSLKDLSEISNGELNKVGLKGKQLEVKLKEYEKYGKNLSLLLRISLSCQS